MKISTLGFSNELAPIIMQCAMRQSDGGRELHPAKWD